jgi:tetratricopeptide (TPR) repeat protein
MKLFESLQRRRVEKLSQKGYELIDEEEFDRALAVAEDLERLRYSAAFEIAALAHEGKGDLAAAVRALERGVERAPDVWLNWQLLGNYRSDLGVIAEAGQAYERALECPGVSRSSIRLNQAILANRTGDHAAALRLAGEVDDPATAVWAAALRVDSLTALGKREEAERLGLQILSEADEDANADPLCNVALNIAQIRLDRGDPRLDVRAFAVQQLERDPDNNDLLALIRDIDGLYSETAQYYRLLIRGHLPEDHPMAGEAEGFYSNWQVLADSPDEALDFIRAIDRPAVPLTLEEWEAAEERSRDPKGVYWRSGRAYFQDED